MRRELDKGEKYENLDQSKMKFAIMQIKTYIELSLLPLTFLTRLIKSCGRNKRRQCS